MYYAHVTMSKECCSVDQAAVSVVVLPPGGEVANVQFNLFVRDPDHSETVSSGGIIRCEANGQIWVQGKSAGSIYGGDHAPETIFSAFKIDGTV